MMIDGMSDESAAKLDALLALVPVAAHAPILLRTSDSSGTLVGMRNQWIARGLFLLLGVVLSSVVWGICLAVTGDEPASDTPRASNVGAEAVDDEGDSEESPPPTLTTSDFTVRVAITDRECFGSAGCNVEFSVEPSYVGTADPSSGHYRVTYEVRGVEDGPQVASFELEGESLSFEPEGSGGTRGASQKIAAVVTGVELLSY